MKKNYLIVVDMQNDFVDGALGTQEAQAVVPGVVKKVRTFDGEVLFTQDTHGADYLDTQEGKHLPVLHCIKGSEGWKLVPALEEIRRENGYLTFEKPTFGSVDLAQFLLERYQKGEVGSVELIGLCTDICVISNALLIKAYMPQLPVFLDASCCAGVTPSKHEAALRTMESCQVQIKREK